MTRKRRQMLCLLLALLMCVSLLPVSAFGEEETAPVDPDAGSVPAESAEALESAEPAEDAPIPELAEEAPEEQSEQNEEQLETSLPAVETDLAQSEMEMETAEAAEAPEASSDGWEIEVEEGVFQGYDASAAAGEGVFQLNGIHDTDYPVLEEFILEEDGATVAAGDTVHFKLKFSDADGIGSNYLYFGISSSSSRYISLTENIETGYYEGSYQFTVGNIPGEYYVTSCHVYDKLGYYTHYDSNSMRVMKRFCPGSVFLSGDSESPVSDIANFEFLENGQTLQPGDKLHVSFDIPAGFNASYVSIRFSAGSRSLEMEWSRWNSAEENTLSYDAATGHVSGEYTLTADTPNGTYRSIYIYAYNYDNNENISESYYNNGYGFSFTGGADAEGITITDVTCEENGKTLTDGDTVHVSFRVNTSQEVTSATVYFNNFETGTYSYGSGVSHSKNSIYANASLDEASGLYKAAYTFKKEDVYGVYRVTVHANSANAGSYASSDTDILFSFAEDKNEGFKRCEPASNLNWTGDGYTRFTLPADHTGRFSVYVYNAADPSSSVTGVTYWGSGTDGSWTAETGCDVFRRNHRDEPLKTGDYYFTVTVLGDGVNNYDSVIAKSGIFHYTAPDRKLGFAENLKWESSANEENQVGRFTVPAAEREFLGDYEYRFSYSKTENGPKVDCGMIGYGSYENENWDKQSGTVRIYDQVLQTYGEGYYYFQIRLLSNDILKCQNGSFGALSPAYHVGQVSASVAAQLDDVKTSGKTPEEIKSQVQAIPTEDLKQAMLSSDSVVSRIHQLETAAGTGTDVSVKDVPVLSTGVRAVGAGLNDTVQDGKVTLVIEKPKREDVLPSMYKNAVAVRFSMDLDNVADTANLKVPVLIDLPIPANINPSFLVLLHYPADGGEPESLFPTIYLAGNQYYAQFALTGFSDYILTEKINAIFTDVSDPNAYFFNPVYWAVDNGITVGAGGEGLFSPYAACTREQIVTFLWRLKGEPEPTEFKSFTDVPSTAWYYKPISWAAQEGITTGYADGTGRFGVGDPCTREQSVTFLWRAAGKPAPLGGNNFTDMNPGAYYIDAVSWAAENGITVGLNDGTGRFGVGGTCNRAMIVTFLFRYNNAING